MHPLWTELRRSNGFDTERADRKRNNTPHKNVLRIVKSGMRHAAKMKQNKCENIR